jgi:hypothetical protein
MTGIGKVHFMGPIIKRVPIAEPAIPMTTAAPTR